MTPSRLPSKLRPDEGETAMHEGFEIVHGKGPLVATALHAGHALRDEVAERLQVDEVTRRREEDPYTDLWTVLAPTRVIATRSRFEVDLNRPREQAVYRGPCDAWGIEIWREPPGDGLLARSLRQHDAFYAEVGALLDGMVARHGRVALVDLHAYCHRRGGPDAEPDDPGQNPEINLGTRWLDRDACRPLIDRFADDLRAFDFDGRHLDVRENVKFQGGHFIRWVTRRYQGQVCTLPVEVKKFFVDEWTDTLDTELHRRIGAALQSAVPGLLEELAR